jgi:hypothetical protein
MDRINTKQLTEYFPSLIAYVLFIIFWFLRRRRRFNQFITPDEFTPDLALDLIFSGQSGSFIGSFLSAIYGYDYLSSYVPDRFPLFSNYATAFVIGWISGAIFSGALGYFLIKRRNEFLKSYQIALAGIGFGIISPLVYSIYLLVTQ